MDYESIEQIQRRFGALSPTLKAILEASKDSDPKRVAAAFALLSASIEATDLPLMRAGCWIHVMSAAIILMSVLFISIGWSMVKMLAHLPSLVLQVSAFLTLFIGCMLLCAAIVYWYVASAMSDAAHDGELTPRKVRRVAIAHQEATRRDLVRMRLSALSTAIPRPSEELIAKVVPSDVREALAPEIQMVRDSPDGFVSLGSEPSGRRGSPYGRLMPRAVLAALALTVLIGATAIW